MGWLIALGILVVLAILPLGASVVYGQNGPFVWILAGPVKIRVYPAKKKAKQDKIEKQKPEEQPEKPEEKPKADKKAPKAEKKQQPADPDEKGGSILDFFPFVELALDFLGDFRRKLRVDKLKLHMTMAADDPCDLAVNYGRANGEMATLLAQLERLFVIKRRDVHINCDFTADQTTIFARLDLTITLGRIVSLVVRYGIRALKTYLSIQKKRKGGANL